MNALIVRNDATLGVSISLDAEAMKLAALKGAALVGRVTTAAEQERAVEAQLELRRVLKFCEDSRVEIKAPVIDYGKRIDAAAKEFSAEVKEEELRVVQLIADFQALEAARVRASEVAKRMEEERIERERQAEIRRIAEAEAETKRNLDAEAAAAAAKLREAKNEEDRIKAALETAEIERQKSLAIAESHAKLDAVNEKFCAEAAALPTATAARAEGQVVKFDWEITVKDLWALARSHPMCVKIEPRLNEIKSLLDSGAKVAGVDAKKVPKSSVRVGFERKAIEV